MKRRAYLNLYNVMKVSILLLVFKALANPVITKQFSNLKNTHTFNLPELLKC